jgi:histidyl-tRNA synthetase
LKTITPLEVGGFGVQLKQATRHQARYAVLFGDAELAQGQVLVKNLETGAQDAVAIASIASYFSA